MVAVIPNFKPTFHISLKISNIRVEGGKWYNIFKVTKPGTTDYNEPGNRMAAIYFNRKKSYFHIVTDRNGTPNNYVNKKVQKTSQDGNIIVYEGPYQFDFIQKKNENGEYVIKITLNGETLVNEVNSEPKSVEGAELFIGDGYQTLNAEIEDFKLQTGKYEK